MLYNGHFLRACNTHMLFQPRARLYADLRDFCEEGIQDQLLVEKCW